MITEDYVSFEIAKLLKEKGFDVKCEYCYAEFSKDDIEVIGLSNAKCVQSLKEDRYPYVTLQMAMKWLREKYRLNIEILIVGLVERSDIPVKWKYRIYDSANNIDYSNNIVFCTYEQAADSAIKYALENLTQ